jgi:NhaP-type Na+/H+ or K+/H+ antiporter
VLAALFHSVLAVETAAQQGAKVVEVMLATGLVFVGVIALGQLSHWVAKQRRRSNG